jgi:(heptosyl)LPS beta-1,4-glucosyltransferase
MKISATIIVLNEERNIGPCLDSLGFADEIVVVDSGSTDRTREICEAHDKVRFYERPWEGFGKQKNLAASLASTDWVFNIDADERVSPELRTAIEACDGRLTAYRVARENYFGDRRIRHCGWYPDFNVRLYDRRACSFSERAVHEAVRPTGPIGTLSGNLVHRTYRGIGDYLKRMDRYTSLAAEEKIASQKAPTLLDLVLRPPFTFGKMYVLKRGFLDGRTGFLLSVLYAFYTFVKYAKALEQKKLS